MCLTSTVSDKQGKYDAPDFVSARCRKEIRPQQRCRGGDGFQGNLGLVQDDFRTFAHPHKKILDMIIDHAHTAA